MAAPDRVIQPVMQWENQSAVTSCHVGRKTGEYCVVGTAEGCLHMWHMHEAPSCAFTTGVVQTGSVQTVHLDNWETKVVVGSSSGSMKIVDVESERIAESFLTAHRTAVTTIASHPVEPHYLVTGSLDSTVKYWDVRQAQPQQVLKGLHGGITSMGVSPDGRWIASGDENGKLSYVDIRKWRAIADFQCDGAVRCIRLHPLELLLACGTSNGVVHAFDVSYPPQRSYDVTYSKVHPVWGVELLPGECQEDFMITSGPEGMRVHRNQDQICSIDVPWEGQVLETVYVEGAQRALHITANRKNLTVWATPTASLAALAKGGGTMAVVPPPQPQQHRSAPAMDSAPVVPPQPVASAPAHSGHPNANANAYANPMRKVESARAMKSPTHARPSPGSGARGGAGSQSSHIASRFHLIRNPDYAGKPIVPAEPSVPLELNLAKWRTAGRDRASLHLEKTELQLAKEIHTTGAKMERLLRNRAEALKIIRGLWTNGDRTGAIAHAERAGQKDFGILVDLLTLTANNHHVKESIQTEQCLVLLPLVQALIAQGIDPSALVAIRVLRFLYNKFIPAAQRTLAAPQPIGVDVAFSDRLHRARELRNRFLSVRKPLVDLLNGRPSAPVAEEGHQVLRDLDAIGAQG